ncbi:MAG TPA: phosphatidylinositol-specific phospholipase C [Polyangia bacterium]|nr:phosphatidylinositol-specific phospholipase C [Polyangia bacterium]
MTRARAAARHLLTASTFVALALAGAGCGGSSSPHDLGDLATSPHDLAIERDLSVADAGVPDLSAGVGDLAIDDGSAADLAPTDLAPPYTGSNWLGAIPGATSLAALSIPGTHDTGALFEDTPGATKTQNLAVPDQLTAGIRYFDIRTRNVNNQFEIYHLTVDQNLSFATVLQNIYDFLAANPTEAVIMSVKEEQPETGSTNTFEQTFDTYTAQHMDSWYLGATIPTLDAVRGKIVLLRRFSATTTPKGLDATVWSDNTTFTINNGSATLQIQDYYDVPDDTSKWTAIANQLAAAKSGGTSDFYINHTSAYEDADGGLENIPSVSDVINPEVTSYFTTNTFGRYGAIVMDFADTTKSGLVIKTNFK